MIGVGWLCLLNTGSTAWVASHAGESHPEATEARAYGARNDRLLPHGYVAFRVAVANQVSGARLSRADDRLLPHGYVAFRVALADLISGARLSRAYNRLVPLGYTALRAEMADHVSGARIGRAQ